MNRALMLLGLCQRAGKLVSGEQAVVDSVRRGRAYAVLLDAAAARNTRKSVSDACRFREIPLREAPANELGDAIGKPGRMAVAITDEKLSARILELTDLQITIGG